MSAPQISLLSSLVYVGSIQTGSNECVYVRLCAFACARFLVTVRSFKAKQVLSLNKVTNICAETIRFWAKILDVVWIQ